MGKWDTQNKANKAWCKRNPKQVRRIMRTLHYRNRYGQTVADYEFLLHIQDGCCAICKRKDNYDKKYFAIDHDHYTGETRGLLCSVCNLRVGRGENIGLPENSKGLKQVEKYLDGKVFLDHSF